jgi:two-component system chemotaxis sensor kinase CheA
MVDVAEVLAINRADFETHNILSVRGQAVPLVDVARLLALPQATGRAGPAFVLITTLTGETTGLIVDQVAGRQEIVLKPLEGLLRQVPGLSGATILGDGRVVLVLDLYALLREEVERLTPRRR